MCILAFKVAAPVFDNNNKLKTKTDKYAINLIK